MKLSEKAYWFGLGMMFPFAVGGIFMLFKEMNSGSPRVAKTEVAASIGESNSDLLADEPKAEAKPEDDLNLASVDVPTPPLGAPDEPIADDVEEPGLQETPGVAALASPSGNDAEAAVAIAEPKPKEPEAVYKIPEPEEEPKPEPPAIDPAKSYVVKSGDNPWTIAKNLGISMDELLAVNNISDAKQLQIGQILKIPKGATGSAEGPSSASTSGSSAASSSSGNSSYYMYTMKAGENPWEVSKKLGVSYTKMEQMNSSLNFRKLRPGTQIKIPK